MFYQQTVDTCRQARARCTRSATFSFDLLLAVIWSWSAALIAIESLFVNL